MKTIVLLTIMLLLTLTLAFFDAVDEGNHLSASAVFALLPAAVLFIHDWIALEMKLKTETLSFAFVYAVFANGVTVIVYCGYALSGPSQPDTAAHLHVLVFPTALAVIGIPGLALFSAIDLIRGKKASSV